MEAKTKQDLIKTAVISGIGASCLAVAPSLSDTLIEYGKEIADIVAIIAQALGAGVLVVAGIKLLPYIIGFIKHLVISLRQKNQAQGKQVLIERNQKTQSNIHDGELNKKLANNAKIQKLSGSKARRAVCVSRTVTTAVEQKKHSY